MVRGILSRLTSGQRNLDLYQSIVEHLQVMLNTCVGDSVTVSDFGMLDLTDTIHSLPEGIHTIQQSIRDVILKYEPRLKNVSIRFVPKDNPLVLHFEIVARLNDASRSVIRLQTEMLANGEFKML